MVAVYCDIAGLEIGSTFNTAQSLVFLGMIIHILLLRHGIAVLGVIVRISLTVAHHSGYEAAAVYPDPSTADGTGTANVFALTAGGLDCSLVCRFFTAVTRRVIIRPRIIDGGLHDISSNRSVRTVGRAYAAAQASI